MPEEARVTLTELMIRLILDHAAAAQASLRGVFRLVSIALCSARSARPR